VRPATCAAALLQPRRPAGGGHDGPAQVLVPEEDLTLAIAQHTHVDRGEGGGAEFGGAPGVAVAFADALQEVDPEVLGVVALERAGDELAAHVLQTARDAGTAAHPLRQDFQAELP